MHPTLALLSWTPADLVHHLWQSSVIALALLVLMGLCARFSARTRLTLVWMALAKFALPFGILAMVVTLLGGNPQNWAVSVDFRRHRPGQKRKIPSKFPELLNNGPPLLPG